MSIGKNIRRLRKAKKMTIQQLADMVESDVGNISRLERDQQGYSHETLKKISIALGIEIAALFADEVNVEEVDLSKRGKVPLISFVQAGNWTAIEDPFCPGDAEDWLICPVSHSSSTYALRVMGDSMFNPTGSQSFKEGDFIFVDPERPYHNKSLVVIRLDDDVTATFKRLIIDGNTQYLEALNPAWPTRFIPIDKEATFCGVVIAKVESFV